MQAEERVEVLALGLSDDLAVVVLVVAVHHHTVEAGEVADRTRGGVVKLGQRGGPVQLLYRAAHRLVGVRKGERPFAVGDLELDQEHTARLTVQDGVELPWLAGDVNHALERVALMQTAEGRGRVLDRAACSAPISADRWRPRTASTGRPSRSATLALT